MDNISTKDITFEDINKTSINAYNSISSNEFKLEPLVNTLYEIKNIEYVIEPFIQKDAVTMLFGESGSFKSFLALDLSLCTVHNKEFHSHRVNAGPVVYLCGEGMSGIKQRVRAWLVKNNISTLSSDFLINNLPSDLMNPNEIQKICNEIERNNIRHPALMVIDTLSTNISSGDENNNNDMQHMLHNLSVNLRNKYKCAIIIIHHNGHSDLNRERGAYVLRANTDNRIKVTRNENPLGLTISCLKNKDRPDWPDHSFKVEVIEIDEVNGDTISSLVLEQIDNSEIKFNNAKNNVNKAHEKLLEEAIMTIVSRQISNLKKSRINPSEKILLKMNDIKIEFRSCYENIYDSHKNVKDSSNKAWKRLINSTNVFNNFEIINGDILVSNFQFD